MNPNRYLLHGLIALFGLVSLNTYAQTQRLWTEADQRSTAPRPDLAAAQSANSTGTPDRDPDKFYREFIMEDKPHVYATLF